LRLLRVMLGPVLVLALLRMFRSSLRDMVPLGPLLLFRPIGLLVLIVLLWPAFFLPLRLVRLLLGRRGFLV